MEINILAVLVAAIIANILGGIWYSPRVFGTTWMKLLGWDPHNQAQMAQMKKNAGKSYTINAFASIVLAYVLAHFIITSRSAAPDTSPLFIGIETAVWSWLGFVVPVSLGSVLWEGKPWKLFFLNTMYYLVSLVSMGLILGIWQ